MKKIVSILLIVITFVLSSCNSNNLEPGEGDSEVYGIVLCLRDTNNQILYELLDSEDTYDINLSYDNKYEISIELRYKGSKVVWTEYKSFDILYDYDICDISFIGEDEFDCDYRLAFIKASDSIIEVKYDIYEIKMNVNLY